MQIPRISARHLFLLLLILILCIHEPLTAYGLDEGAVHAFIQKAEELHLSEDPQWLALVHYDKSFPAYSNSSRTEERSFFFAEDGITNPQAELSYTLTAFLTSSVAGDENPRCRFPARFQWLSRKLDLPRALSSNDACPSFDKWFGELNPSGITVIFPTSFVNNPASSFGHTFLRLDQPNQNEETRLLAYTVNYAAATQGEDALTYAAKGIFGGYPGIYAVSPYYQKITKYSDLENRDIWEYELSLDQEEVKLLALHLWELREVPFSYYYFDENCAYHILALLDVARPSLHLVGSMHSWIIPVDTLRELVSRAGIIKSTVFRPSAATKLRARIAAASLNLQKAALTLSDDTFVLSATNTDTFSPEEKAKAFDLAYDYHTYQRIKERNESAENKKRAWDLLTIRSTLPAIPPLVIDEPKRPELGHKTGLFSIAAGRSGRRWIEETTIRPAFHALSDYQVGYTPGSQIKFLESVFRQTEAQGLSFERLTLLNITSLTAQDRFFHPLSWQVNLEERRLQLTDDQHPYLSELSAAFGKSYSVNNEILFYGLIGGMGEFSGAIDDNYALGIGPKFGFAATPFDWMASDISFSAQQFELGDTHTLFSASASQRFSITPDRAIRFDIIHDEEYARTVWKGFLRMEFFFTPP